LQEKLEEVGKSKASNQKLGKSHRALRKEEGYWMIDFPKLKKEKGPKSDVNNEKVDDGTHSDSSVLSLSITSTICYSEKSE